MKTRNLAPRPIAPVQRQSLITINKSAEVAPVDPAFGPAAAAVLTALIAASPQLIPVIMDAVDDVRGWVQ